MKVQQKCYLWNKEGCDHKLYLKKADPCSWIRQISVVIKVIIIFLLFSNLIYAQVSTSCSCLTFTKWPCKTWYHAVRHLLSSSTAWELIYLPFKNPSSSTRHFFFWLLKPLSPFCCLISAIYIHSCWSIFFLIAGEEDSYHSTCSKNPHLFSKVIWCYLSFGCRNRLSVCWWHAQNDRNFPGRWEKQCKLKESTGTMQLSWQQSWK